MITISVSGRRATASNLVSLPTGNVQSIKVQFVFPLDDSLWQNALIVAVFAAKTPKGAWIVSPGVIDENKQSTIPGDVLRVADSEIYVGARATYADNHETTTNVAFLGKTIMGAGGEIIDMQIQDSEITQATEFLSALYALFQNSVHKHPNKAILDNIGSDDKYASITYRGKLLTIPVVDELPDYIYGEPCPSLCICDDILYRLDTDRLLQGYWVQITSGLSPDDAAGLLQDKHTHANRSTLDKFGESGGKPTFNGSVIGGVQSVASPSFLDNSAANGSVAVALADDPANTIVYPTQTGGEEVSVDISGKIIMIGNPTFNGTAIDSAISAQTVDLTAAVALEDPDGMIQFSIIPVVSDPNTNEYTAAGITLDSYIQASSYANKYAIGAILTAGGIDCINPDKIVDVDANYEKIPFMAIYAFEELSNAEYQGMPMNLSAGWNVALATLDKATHSDVTAIEVVDGAVDLNDYLVLSDDSQNSMTIEGVGASAIFDGVIIGESGRKKGLYVRIDNSWIRCRLDGDQ